MITKVVIAADAATNIVPMRQAVADLLEKVCLQTPKKGSFLAGASSFDGNTRKANKRLAHATGKTNQAYRTPAPNAGNRFS